MERGLGGERGDLTSCSIDCVRGEDRVADDHRVDVPLVALSVLRSDVVRKPLIPSTPQKVELSCSDGRCSSQQNKSDCSSKFWFSQVVCCLFSKLNWKWLMRKNSCVLLWLLGKRGNEGKNELQKSFCCP